jgi:hypothetical protein
MGYSLFQLLKLIENEEDNPEIHLCSVNEYPGDLFCETGNSENSVFYDDSEVSCAIITGMHSPAGLNLSVLPLGARRLFELSIDAFSAIVHAWMSELPVTAEIIRFGRKILAAATAVKGVIPKSKLEAAERQAANRAVTDRGDRIVQVVQGAAYKVWHEIHRMQGLLRFYPGEDGVYVAPCEPDHFIVPALGPYFRERFGETSFAIIDRKRGFCLSCTPEQPFIFYECNNFQDSAGSGIWEKLWRHYHKTINNENRNNPELQKQFMPRRYWKYLTEMQ